MNVQTTDRYKFVGKLGFMYREVEVNVTAGNSIE